MLIPITALYAVPLTLIGFALTQLVGRERLRVDVSLNHGDDPRLVEAIRRHANFIETVPLALLLLLILELNGAHPLLLHGLGTTLVAARIIHPFGIHFDRMRSRRRLVGALATVLVTLIAVGAIAWQLATR